MTSHVARLYAAATGIVVFFLAWAAIAAHPWTTPAAKADPAVAALAAREQRVRAESAAVRRLLAKRWAAYRVALAARRKAIAAQQAAVISAPAPVPAASPGVRIVTLPPLTITRTS